MPTSIVVAAVAAGIGTSAAVIAAVGTFGAALLGGLAASVIGGVFAKAKQRSLAADPGGRLETVRQAISPWQWIYGQTRVGGTITFIHAAEYEGRANQVLHLVITLSGHEVEEIGQVYFNDQAVTLDGEGTVTDTTFAQEAAVLKSLGNEAGQPFNSLVAESNGAWSDAHRQTGRAKLYVKLNYNQDVFAGGIPKVTALVKGRKVYDPRSGLTAWSDNWALCMADYLTNREIGLGCDYDSEIDEAQLIAAANICDETVTLAAGGTEKRYTMNGALQADISPREALGFLNTAAHGVVRFIGGAWKICPAAYATPDPVALTVDDLRGDIHVVPRVSRRDLCNRVKGIYSSPANFWQPTDFPPVTNATYLDEDDDEEIWRELDLPFTDSASMAQRIAKIDLERVRQQILVEWPGKLTCYRLQPGDTVPLTVEQLGWTDKIFEVVSTRLVFESAGEDGGVVLGCDLVLRETATSVYDWSAGEETTVDPAPDTNLPDALTVASPGAPDVTEELYETRDGRGVGAKAVITLVAAADAFVVYYQLEYRPAGGPTWAVLPIQTSTRFEILDILPARYDFRAKALNNLGVSSPYSTVMDIEIKGLTATPAEPTGLSIQAGGGTARLKLDQAPELDVRRGGRVLIRFCHDGSSVTWENSFSIGEPEGYPGDSTQIDLPLKPGTYLVKFRDSTGHESETWAEIETKQASVLEFTTLATVTFDADFDGTHSGTAAVDGSLTLGGVGLFDDIPDLDAEADLDGFGGIEAEGTWTAATGMDLGSVTNVRVTSQVEGAVDGVLDQIDSRADSVDAWLDWDGASAFGSASDAWMEVRETDDNPGGSPVWSEWKRLDAAEFSARAFQFRARLTTSDMAYRPVVSTLRAKAEEIL